METVYYEDPEVCVTSERVIVRGRNVPLGAFREVEQIIEEPAKIGWPAAAMCLSAMASLLTLGRDIPEVSFLWVVATLFCGAWMAATGTWYFIALVDSAQSEWVMATKNESFARDVVRAIQQALSNQCGAVPGSIEDEVRH